MSNVQGAVALSGVVPDLNVVVDCAGELDTSLPALAVKRLGLHPRPERLDHRIIERGAAGPPEGPEDQGRREREPGDLAACTSAADLGVTGPRGRPSLPEVSGGPTTRDRDI